MKKVNIIFPHMNILQSLVELKIGKCMYIIYSERKNKTHLSYSQYKRNLSLFENFRETQFFSELHFHGKPLIC